MVKYFELDGKIVKLENETITKNFSCHISVNRYNLIEEDGIFDGIEVHEGDIVVTFYDQGSNGKTEYIIYPKDSLLSKKVLSIKSKASEKETILNLEKGDTCESIR